MKYCAFCNWLAVCSVSGAGKLCSAHGDSASQKLPFRQLLGGKQASYSSSVGFSEKQSYYATLKYRNLKLRSYCVSVSPSWGHPLAFASGPGV